MEQERQISKIIREYRDRMSVSVVEKMFASKEGLRNKYKHLLERLVSDVQFHIVFVLNAR